MPPFIQFDSITKTFGGVVALRDVTLGNREGRLSRADGRKWGGEIDAGEVFGGDSSAGFRDDFD